MNKNLNAKMTIIKMCDFNQKTKIPLHAGYRDSLDGCLYYPATKNLNYASALTLGHRY